MAERELVKCRRCWNLFDPIEGDGACPVCLAREEDFLPSAERRRLKGAMFAKPAFFSQIVARLQWDPMTIDLAPDARAWPELPDERRRRLTTLLSAFCVAEEAVSEHLTPFASATPDTLVAWVFFLQRRDEERHAQFFDRIAAEVLKLPGDTAAERRAASREHVPPDVLELFEVRLPAMAAELAAGQIGLDQGIALYHMVLEGNVFSAGQRALLEELEDGVLPGVQEGVQRVERDERWHIGFGVRNLIDIQPAQELLHGLLARAEEAAQAWGDAVSTETREYVARLCARRLHVAGLIDEPVVA
jgi:ribonucleoside-diphosphate reductase beta chain